MALRERRPAALSWQGRIPPGVAVCQPLASIERNALAPNTVPREGLEPSRSDFAPTFNRVGASARGLRPSLRAVTTLGESFATVPTRLRRAGATAKLPYLVTATGFEPVTCRACRRNARLLSPLSYAVVFSCCTWVREAPRRSGSVSLTFAGKEAPRGVPLPLREEKTALPRASRHPCLCEVVERLIPQPLICSLHDTTRDCYPNAGARSMPPVACSQ